MCTWTQVANTSATPCLVLHRYRAAEEMKAWRARDPVTRFQLWLVQQGWWSDEQDKEARAAARRWAARTVCMLQAILAASQGAGWCSRRPVVAQCTGRYAPPSACPSNRLLSLRALATCAVRWFWPYRRPRRSPSRPYLPSSTVYKTGCPGTVSCLSHGVWAMVLPAMAAG